jgi:hypothetical protein
MYLVKNLVKGPLGYNYVRLYSNVINYDKSDFKTMFLRV